jgi:hypothetical protein
MKVNEEFKENILSYLSNLDLVTIAVGGYNNFIGLPNKDEINNTLYKRR